MTRHPLITFFTEVGREPEIYIFRPDPADETSWVLTGDNWSEGTPELARVVRHPDEHGEYFTAKVGCCHWVSGMFPTPMGAAFGALGKLAYAGKIS